MISETVLDLTFTDTSSIQNLEYPQGAEESPIKLEVTAY